MGPCYEGPASTSMQSVLSDETNILGDHSSFTPESSKKLEKHTWLEELWVNQNKCGPIDRLTPSLKEELASRWPRIVLRTLEQVTGEEREMSPLSGGIYQTGGVKRGFTDDSFRSTVEAQLRVENKKRGVELQNLGAEA
mmetsp:Transcript_16249/g.29728  ORF Transcript_16249/g.29728 Transcript_16249/m.29728 type:complete len:139 (+) Transcript_16249:126-542(+)